MTKHTPPFSPEVRTRAARTVNGFTRAVVGVVNDGARASSAR